MADGARGVDFITIDGGKGRHRRGAAGLQRSRCAAVQGRLQPRYGRGFGLPSAIDCDEVRRLMSPRVD